MLAIHKYNIQYILAKSKLLYKKVAFFSKVIYIHCMKEIRKRSCCAISTALDIIGDKWALLIVRDMAFHGKSTYCEFLKSEEGIATNVLADKLVLLERSGLVEKKPHPDSKLKILYRLTQKGIDLVPVLVDIIIWSDQYLDISENGRRFAENARKDREGTIRQVLENLKEERHTCSSETESCGIQPDSSICSE